MRNKIRTRVVDRSKEMLYREAVQTYAFSKVNSAGCVSVQLPSLLKDRRSIAMSIEFLFEY